MPVRYANQLTYTIQIFWWTPTASNVRFHRESKNRDCVPVNFHPYAPANQVDVDHQQPLVLHPDELAFHTHQWASDDLDALSRDESCINGKASATVDQHLYCPDILFRHCC